ncbi:hypothetical protein Tco_1559789 [Tanacetum coccineum]
MTKQSQEVQGSKIQDLTSGIRRPHIRGDFVQDVYHKKSLNVDVIVVENDHDVIHDNNSSNLALSASLNDLDLAPPNIILVDEDDDFIDDEDDVPHDLADFDDEVLANANDDDEATTIIYSSDEED